MAKCDICEKKVSFGAGYYFTMERKSFMMCSQCHALRMKLMDALQSRDESQIQSVKSQFIERTKNKEFEQQLEKFIEQMNEKEEKAERKKIEEQNKVEEKRRAENSILDKKNINLAKVREEIEEYKRKKEEEIVFSINGARGRCINVYPDKCTITAQVTAGSIITGNATDGEKTIYYQDCVGLQFKKPGITIGYLQLETASALGNNLKDNFFNENTFTFEPVTPEIEAMYEYVQWRLDIIKRKMLEK